MGVCVSTNFGDWIAFGPTWRDAHPSGEDSTSRSFENFSRLRGVKTSCDPDRPSRNNSSSSLLTSSAGFGNSNQWCVVKRSVEEGPRYA